METTFTKQETIKLIEEYYKRLEERAVKVKIKAKKTCIGLYEIPDCLTTVEVNEKLEIAGIVREVKWSLNESEVIEKLRALFSLYDLNLKSANYEDGLSSRSEGYGYGEHTVETAYFKGVKVIFEKQKNQVLERTL